MMALIPALLAMVALAVAVVVMVRRARTPRCGAPVPVAGDPLFFVRFRPGIDEIEPPMPPTEVQKSDPASENS